MKFRYYLLAALFASSCTSDPPVEEGSSDPLAAQADEGCPDIFKQEAFPNYFVAISAEEWAALEDEFLNRVEREAMNLDIHPYHPIKLTYEDETIDAMIRLKGQSSWLQAIAFDANPKMQFVISFNEVDKDRRFHGVRKVELDMPRTDGSFLRQRIGLYYLRRAGAIAQCANSATLTVNGEFYGLYTHLERLNKDFLKRNFEGLDKGDLWEGGIKIETNEDSFDMTRINNLWAATSVEELEGIVDLETSIQHWGLEAMASQGDGYYNGRANFFLYDHPLQGFMWLSHDLDSTFDYLPADMSPLYPTCEARHYNDRKHWNLVMADAGWQARYVQALEDALVAYDAPVLQQLIADWAGQIYEAADADLNKPFTTFDHELAIQNLIEYPPERAKTLDEFLECRSLGGIEDFDGDGYFDCFECNDQDPDAYPGAPERCNGFDDDCDGLVDEGLEC